MTTLLACIRKNKIAQKFIIKIITILAKGKENNIDQFSFYFLKTISKPYVMANSVLIYLQQNSIKSSGTYVFPTPPQHLLEYQKP